MARAIARGEIWQLRRPLPDKRRPVLVLSRPALIQVLHTVTVAAITSTIRGSPTEVQLGVSEGLKTTCCVNLTNIFTVRQSELSRYVGVVDRETMNHVCKALAIAVGCDGS